MAAVVTLPVGRPPESQTVVQISTDPGAPCLHHHVGRDEFMVRAELHVVIDPVERQHQVQFIGRPGGTLSALTDLPTVIEIRQGIRAEAAVLEYAPRYQELRPVNVPRISGFIRNAAVTSPKTTRRRERRDENFCENLAQIFEKNCANISFCSYYCTRDMIKISSISFFFF